MSSSDQEIIDLLQQLVDNSGGRGGGGTGGGPGQPVSISVSNEELDEFNNNLVIQRNEIQRMREELAGLQQGSDEYLELQQQLTIAAHAYNEEQQRTTKLLRDQKEAQADLAKVLKDGKKAILGFSGTINEVQSLAYELERTGAK